VPEQFLYFDSLLSLPSVGARSYAISLPFIRHWLFSNFIYCFFRDLKNLHKNTAEDRLLHV